MCYGKDSRLQSPMAWVRIPALLLKGCVTLGKLPSLSVFNRSGMFGKPPVWTKQGAVERSER